MRFYVWGLIAAVVLMSAIGRVGAQDVVPPRYSEGKLLPGQEVLIRTNMYDVTLLDLSIGADICPEILYDANRESLPAFFDARVASMERILTEGIFIPLGAHISEEMAYTLVIPPHESCFIQIKRPYIDEKFATNELPQIEKDYNVCVEEIYGPYFYRVDKESAFYARRDARPCLNDEGQRLAYHQAKELEDSIYNLIEQQGLRLSFVGIWKPWVSDGYSALPWIEGPEDFKSLGYCVDEMHAVNPSVPLPQTMPIEDDPYQYPFLYQYPVGRRLFVPQDMRRCDFVLINSESLYSLSQKHNICMEAILDSSNLSMYAEKQESYSLTPENYYLAVPLNGPACYDETGHRLDVPEEIVYMPQPGESFLDVARKHDICMDRLWDANPVMNDWDGESYRMPDVFFIPVERPCAFTRTLTSRPKMTLIGLATLTNVCRNRIQDANPHLGLEGREDEYPYRLPWEVISTGKLITIPDRPACYHLIAQSEIRQVDYVCYPVPITAEADFSGHEPPITPANDLNLPYCYPNTENMTVIYNNAPYTWYRRHGYETLITIGQCFGVAPTTLILGESEDNVWTWLLHSGVLIPQPHNTDCWMLEENDDTHKRLYQEKTYNAGYVIDEGYIVNYNDTLSSIGRKLGYLPEWIADANNLSAPYMIYYLQELKLPTYVSLYTLASRGGVVGFVVLVSSAIYGLRRWRRSRAKGKQKNEAA